jgi:hypothetical protein
MYYIRKLKAIELHLLENPRFFSQSSEGLCINLYFRVNKAEVK